MRDRRARPLAVLTVAAIAVAAAAALVGPGQPRFLVGRVADPAGAPLPDAVVRIQTTETSAVTDERGRFSLPVPDPGAAVRLTAWAPGYTIGGGIEQRAGDDVALVLTPIPVVDDAGYQWLPSQAVGDLATRLPSATPVEGENQGCAACHSRDGTGVSVDLPVDQWRLDAHSRSAVNPRFVTMYLGTDVAGNQSPPTRFADSRDYGPIPLRPDPDLPYRGPGYRLDFPGSPGNCAACHTPAASIGDPYGVDPTALAGVAAEGIGCDFCHKVWDVHLDPTGLPDPNRPGVLSFEFRRPSEGHQFFAGPFDDVAPGEDTYVPLYAESAYCAPCHHGVFWGTVVYDSYGEWLASPYADPVTGRTCQDCHMPPTGAEVFAAPEAGGLVRDPDRIPGHLMPGAADPSLLEAAVSMTVTAEVTGRGLEVAVTIVNDQTGHHVPTDSPLRHLILLVEATGPDGPLALIEGPVVPAWGGVGDPADGAYAGLPGTAYAKVLEELWTEVSPTGAYWNQTRVLSDNRIAALGSDTTTYVFSAPAGGSASVAAVLVFRRAYYDLAQQKGWGLADLVMETGAVTVP